MIFRTRDPRPAPEFETWHQMKTRWLDERREAVARCSALGMSISETAKYFATSPAVIVNAAKKDGVNFTPKPRRSYQA